MRKIPVLQYSVVFNAHYSLLFEKSPHFPAIKHLLFLLCHNEESLKNLDFRNLSPFYIRLSSFSDHLCVFFTKFSNFCFIRSLTNSLCRYNFTQVCTLQSYETCSSCTWWNAFKSRMQEIQRYCLLVYSALC